MGRLTVRLSDELHERLRKAAGSRAVNGYVLEAVAEKIGRAELGAEVAELRARVEALERRAGRQQSA